MDFLHWGKRRELQSQEASTEQRLSIFLKHCIIDGNGLSHAREFRALLAAQSSPTPSLEIGIEHRHMQTSPPPEMPKSISEAQVLPPEL
ncbi:hypothetical protein E5288_WYG019845 [Bos mutus]|uniref:Uncharacterized protein n=1 Tax=Bos mutus TaxID=72004 RepID=A0A6B0RPE1_9CETA|nr:hypothetical protein [Bos mutus]